MSDSAATEPNQTDALPDADLPADDERLDGDEAADDGEATDDGLEVAEVAEVAEAADDDNAPADRNGDDSTISVPSVIEAILFSSDAPLPAPKISRVVSAGGAREVKKHVDALNERYAAQGAAFRIEEVAGGYQMLTLPDFHPWLSKLRQTRAMTRLSKPALETLAIVAYKQPVMRASVEAIRGVASGEMLNRLREMSLVQIVGRAEEVGRPMLYGTTRKFLEVFGLQRLEDLPAVEELKPPA